MKKTFRFLKALCRAVSAYLYDRPLLRNRVFSLTVLAIAAAVSFPLGEGGAFAFLALILVPACFCPRHVFA